MDILPQGVTIHRATPLDADLTTLLVYRLLKELHPKAPIDEARLHRVSQDMLDEDSGYFAFIALDETKLPVSVMTMTEVLSLSAHGLVGVILEHYVIPEARSLGIGEQLLEAAYTLGEERGWTFLRVTAPGKKMGQRTQAFYRRTGFLPAGPVLQKRLRTGKKPEYD